MSFPKDAPDLNKVMAAVGPEVFSFFPIGSLLSGTSPMLVNTIFHDGLFQCLGQTNNLNLSQCQHLRKINDDQLIALIKKIVEIRAASNPEYSQKEERRQSHDCSGMAICSCSTKVTHLDLSRCRFLTGEGIHFCLKHTPNIEQLLLSSAARFDATEVFAQHNTVGALKLRKLEYIDLSGCSRMDSIALKHFMAGIQAQNIRSFRLLDLSGVSSQIDDDIFGTLGFWGNNLESLSLAGAKKVTSFGVGLISYICRDTLKSLNLRGCEGVNLAKLLIADGYDIMLSIQANIDANHRLILPTNFVGDSEILSTNGFFAALCNSMREMINAHSNVDVLIDASRHYMQGYKRLEQRWSNLWGGGERREERIFGQLEQLDIGMIGHSGIKLQGCIAIIAWLNGGRLRQVDLCGLDSILLSDLSVLASTSRHRLVSLSASSSATIPSTINSLGGFFHAMKNISELDLSCCDHWDFGRGGDGAMIVMLTTLRSLKLDHTNINGPTVRAVLAKSKRLLRLSVRGCSNLNSNDLHLGNRLLGLIDIDCRDVQQIQLLSKLREVCPFLLRLNNRCTALGAKMLRAHRSNFLWRVGARERTDNKSKKRKSSGDGVVATSTSSENGADNDDFSTFTNRCSTLWTGFSQAKDTEQEMFACKTCSMDGFGRFVCITCVKLCHKGHDVFSMGSGTGYCDCCIFTPCKCLDRGPVNEDQYNDLDHILDIAGLSEVFEVPFDPSVFNVRRGRG